MSTPINTIEDLDAIRSNLSGEYHLTRDLDFNDDGSYADPANKPTYTTGTGWDPIGLSYWTDPFTGSLDGCGFTIHNLYCDGSAIDNVGLFGGLRGAIRNLILRDITIISGGSNVGAFVGSMGSATALIYRCGSAGGSIHIVTGSSAGGIAGYSILARYAPTAGIVECFSEGITITRGVGGSGGAYGGLYGLIDRTSVIDCRANNILDASLGTINVGGFGGRGSGTGYSASIVGPAGGSRRGYEGDSASVIAGRFWDVEASGNDVAGGATPIATTAEAQTITPYADAGWDIVAVAAGVTDTAHTWNIVEGESYPFLSWEKNPIPWIKVQDEVRLNAGPNTSDIISVGDCIIFNPDSNWPIRVKITDVTLDPVTGGIDHLIGVLMDPIEDPSGLPANTDWVIGRSIITGLAHLEGREVAILGDGFVYATQTVQGGQVDLGSCAVVAHVGLAYSSRLELLPIPTGSGPSADRGRPKNVSKVTVEVEQARRVEAAALTSPIQQGGILSFDDAEPVQSWDAISVEGSYRERRPLQRGVVEVRVPSKWDVDAAVRVQQTEPLPLTILAISREYKTGGS